MKRRHVLYIQSQDQFREMVVGVAKELSPDGLIDPSRREVVDVVRDVWYRRFWSEIFHYFLMKMKNEYSIEEIAPVQSFCNAKFADSIIATRSHWETEADFNAHLRRLSREAFEEAKTSIQNLLIKEQRQLIILMDSIEEYPISDQFWAATIQGFLPAVQRFNCDTSVFLTCALPEELTPFFQKSSGNAMKDFSGRFEFQWKSEDLLRIAAHRLRLHIDEMASTTEDEKATHRMYDIRSFEDTSNRSKKFDFSNKRHVRSFLHQFIPETISNENRGQESALTYILRHTQLVPRNILDIFNRLLVESGSLWRMSCRITSNAIIESVSSEEPQIAKQRLQPFLGMYRGVEDAIPELCRQLPHMFTGKELRKVTQRVYKTTELSQHQLMDLCYRIGIFGAVKDINPNGYIVADFYDGFGVELQVEPGEQFCFHPVFSKLYKAHLRRHGDLRAVLPRQVPSDT